MDHRRVYIVVLLSLYWTLNPSMVLCKELPDPSHYDELYRSQWMPTKPGEFPWSVAIFRKDQLYGRPKNIFLCGGIVHGNGTVLTSVECVRNQLKATLTVRFGRLNLGDGTEQDEEVLEVKTIVHHPGYKPSSKQHNIALLFVKSSTTSSKFNSPVNRVCIGQRNQEYNTGTPCYIVGWDTEFRNGANELLKMPVYLPDRTNCQESIRLFTRLPKFVLSAKDVCASAVGQMGENYPCARITGSALVCDKGDGQHCLVGISSYSLRKCSRARVNDVFVDVREYNEWINDHVENNVIVH